MKLLDYLFLLFCGSSILFYTVDAPIFSPLNSEWGFTLVHILTLAYCCLFGGCHSEMCEAVSFWVLMNISQVSSDAEQLFLCVLTVYMSSLKISVFRACVHFSVGLFGVFDVDLCGFFVYFGFEYLIRYIVCKYLLSFSRLSFHFFLWFPSYEKIFNLM